MGVAIIVFLSNNSLCSWSIDSGSDYFGWFSDLNDFPTIILPAQDGGEFDFGFFRFGFYQFRHVGYVLVMDLLAVKQSN